jgi:hypothetical protein
MATKTAQKRVRRLNSTSLSFTTAENVYPTMSKQINALVPMIADI